MDPLTKEQIDLLRSLKARDIQISCANIELFWDEDWEECPLCSAPVDDKGKVNHALVQ